MVVVLFLLSNYHSLWVVVVTVVRLVFVEGRWVSGVRLVEGYVYTHGDEIRMIW